MGYATERFAKRLKQIRETAGLTQEQFAKELGVSRGTISYYEKGERTPDIEFLNSLYDYFQCTVPFDFLLGNTDNIKEEHRNMYDFYGLTDKACDILDRHPELGHIISVMLEHEDFFVFSRSFEYVINQYKSFNKCELGYISYLITDCLNHIIYDSLIVLREFSLTDEERKEHQYLYEKAQKEIDELLKKLDLEKEEDKKRWGQIEQEDLKKIKEENAKKDDIIDKIYDKFFEATDMLESLRYSR